MGSMSISEIGELLDSITHDAEKAKDIEEIEAVSKRLSEFEKRVNNGNYADNELADIRRGIMRVGTFVEIRKIEILQKR